MTNQKWKAEDMPDLSGRTAIVTGASSGLGVETARGLAAAGARVVLAVRDEAKGNSVAAGIAGDTEVRVLDLGDLASVRSFAGEFEGPVDILVNNAGIMAVPEQRTVDGFEAQFGTNHLGHFALTLLLLPQIRDRVVNVSSDLARRGEIVLDDLNWERRDYKPWPAYSQSKLANLLFTKELQKQLDADGSPVRAYSAHPGVAKTQLQTTGKKLQDLAFKPLMMFAPDASQGALPTLFAASQELRAGCYIGPDGRMGIRHSPTIVEPPPAAEDASVAAALWKRSVELTGVRARG